MEKPDNSIFNLGQPGHASSTPMMPGPPAPAARMAGDLGSTAARPMKPPKAAKKAVAVDAGGSMRLPPTQPPFSGAGPPVGSSFRGASSAEPFSVPPFGGASFRGASSAEAFGGVPPGGSLRSPRQATTAALPPPTVPVVIPDHVPIVSGTSQPIVKCVCSRCGKLFYFESDLQAHTRLRHP
jgi:hypothetical protein